MLFSFIYKKFTTCYYVAINQEIALKSKSSQKIKYSKTKQQTSQIEFLSQYKLLRGFRMFLVNGNRLSSTNRISEIKYLVN